MLRAQERRGSSDPRTSVGMATPVAAPSDIPPLEMLSPYPSTLSVLQGDDERSRETADDAAGSSMPRDRMYGRCRAANLHVQASLAHGAEGCAQSDLGELPPRPGDRQTADARISPRGRLGQAGGLRKGAGLGIAAMSAEILRVPITEEWLKSIGFRWHQFDRQPDRHWLLWLGGAIGDGAAFTSYEDLGIEVAPSLRGSRDGRH